MSHEDARLGARHWPIPLSRAIVAGVAAVAVTFSPDHSSGFGLFVFSGFGLATGLASVLASLRTGSGRSFTGLRVTQGALSAAFGAISLIAAIGGAGAAWLVGIVALWCVATGVTELVAGLRQEGRGQMSRDHVVVAVFTFLLGAAYLIGRNDPVFLVGAFGAYAAIVAVYLVIAALSMRWEPAHSEVTRSAVEH